MLIREHVPIANLTTFQNEGKVDEVISVESLKELRTFLGMGKPYHVLGKGSNTLINPETPVSRFLQISPNWRPPTRGESHTLLAGAGTPVSTLMKACVDFGLAGLEFAAGVPASVGGMVAMNFGCFGQEVSDLVRRVHVVHPTGEDEWLTAEDLRFSYRHSRVLEDHLIVVEAEFQLTPADSETVKSTQNRFIADRLAKQPLRAHTFGSTFKNPEGHFAGALLESSGFKGKVVGNVVFSAQHANFLVNCGGATFQEAYALIQSAQEKVFAIHHLHLETEVQLVL